MNPGLREYRQATVRVAISEALPVEFWERTRELVSLHSNAPRKGYATRLMHKVCYEADRAGIVLVLQPIPFDGVDMTAEQLRKFYAKFGFVEIQQEPVVMMARQVGGKIQ